MSLCLSVLDVNDETPTFFPAVYNVSVSEDVPREFRVVWLNCTDNDVGLNAELSYFITGTACPATRQGPGQGRDRSTEEDIGLCLLTSPRACSWFPGSFETEGVLGVDRGDRVLTGVSLHPTSESSHCRNVASPLPLGLRKTPIG